MGLLDQFQSYQWAANPTIVPEQRGTLLPASIPPHVLGTQPAAQPAVPGVLHAPWQAFQSLWQAAANERGGAVPNDRQNARDAFDVAGAATTGGLLAPKPTGILGSAGGKPGFTAYHGSPHDFDRFSLDKIGTGEGAQAYGHGLYFADAEATAKAYRDTLTQNRVTLNGHTMPQLSGVERDAADYAASYGGKDRALEVINDKIARNSQFDDVEHLKAVRDSLSGAAVDKPTGRMYQVRINADPEHFLDWDKPLAQQSETVKDAINRVARDVEPYGLDKVRDDMRGVDMQQLLRDPAAVQRLREHGVPGIRYLDQGSRTEGTGSRNTVVFNDSLIEIMKKYGLLGPAYLGAQALSGDDQPQQGLIK